MTVTLVPHPHSPALPGRRLEVDIAFGADRTARLHYRLYGPLPVLPAPMPAQRSDDLWKTTCFELFVRSAGAADYAEFNFSPSTQWAAYAFDRYREGMRPLPRVHAPTIGALAPLDGPGYGMTVDVDLSGLADGPLVAAITAVIEEQDGSRSYWSIAHPPAKPDFHDPACFVLELPAPNAP